MGEAMPRPGPVSLSRLQSIYRVGYKILIKFCLSYLRILLYQPNYLTPVPRFFLVCRLRWFFKVNYAIHIQR